jgi:peroxiredoxin
MAFGQKNKLSYCDSVRIMPLFRFYLPSGALFVPDSLCNKNTTVLIYFKTNCPYCAKEADMISENINNFKSVDFIFLSREDTASIISFAKDHNLEKNHSVKFLQDKEKLYHKYYIARYTPSIHIYDKNKKLKIFVESVLSQEEMLKDIQ